MSIYIGWYCIDPSFVPKEIVSRTDRSIAWQELEVWEKLVLRK